MIKSSSVRQWAKAAKAVRFIPHATSSWAFTPKGFFRKQLPNATASYRTQYFSDHARVKIYDDSWSV